MSHLTHVCSHAHPRPCGDGPQANFGLHRDYNSGREKLPSRAAQPPTHPPKMALYEAQVLEEGGRGDSLARFACFPRLPLGLLCRF